MSEKDNVSNSVTDLIPISVTDNNYIYPVDLATTAMGVVTNTNANISPPKKLVSRMSTTVVPDDSKYHTDSALTPEKSNVLKSATDSVPLSPTYRDSISSVDLAATPITIIPATLSDINASKKLLDSSSTTIISSASQSLTDIAVTLENGDASKPIIQHIPISVTDRVSSSQVDITTTSVTVVPATLADATTSNKVVSGISSIGIPCASQFSIDYILTSKEVSTSKSVNHHIPLSVTDRDCISPVDFITTSATLTNGAQKTSPVAIAKTSKSSINLGLTMPITNPAAVEVLSASNSFNTSSSSSGNANDLILPDVCLSRDATSTAFNLLRFKRQLSDVCNSTSMLKQQRSIAIVKSESSNETKSMSENNSVSVIPPDTDSKLSNRFVDGLKSVSHCRIKDPKHETNRDVASIPVLHSNFSKKSPRKKLQVTPNDPKKYLDDPASSPLLDEIKFECKRENESPFSTETSNFQDTSNSPSSSQDGNPVTEALDTVQACALMTMRDVQRLSEFSEYVFSKGHDENNYLFANEANTLLRSLPEHIAIECKGFMLQFLNEVLEFTARNGLLTD